MDNDKKVKTTGEVVDVPSLFGCIDIIKIIVSKYHSPKWFVLCKAFYRAAKEAIDPSRHRGGDPLTWCMTRRNYSAVFSLLENPNTDPAANHNEPLRFATVIGRMDIIKALLRDKRTNPFDRHGVNSAINEALSRGTAEMVCLFLKEGGRTGNDGMYFNCLHMAIAHERLDLLKHLLGGDYSFTEYEILKCAVFIIDPYYRGYITRTNKIKTEMLKLLMSHPSLSGMNIDNDPSKYEVYWGQNGILRERLRNIVASFAGIQ